MSELDPVTGTTAASVDSTQGTYVPPPEQPPVAPPRKSRKGMFFAGALTGCLFVLIGLFGLAVMIAATRSEGSGSFSLSADKVAVVPIEGEILDSRDTIEAIHRHAENGLVKAIVLRINSPGGAIAPSQEIYEEVRKTRARSGKPIVASFDSVAASGGYYIAAACDKIVANPGSITGSIGVILQWMDLEDLVRWAKMKPETITSGPLKAAGSPYKEMTEEERAYFQRIVLQLHQQFVGAVAQGRKMSVADVTLLADGRVFTGQEAVALKLVDELGTLHDAAKVAAELAGVEGQPTMIYPRKRKGGLFDILDSEEATSVLERVISRRMPRFLYRW